MGLGRRFPRFPGPADIILAIRGLGRDQQVKVVLPGFIPDAGQQFAKERIGKPRPVCWDDKGQRTGPLFLEVTSGDVRIIAHLLGRLADPLAGAFGHIAVPCQGARHSGNGATDLLGDILQGDGHVAVRGGGLLQCPVCGCRSVGEGYLTRGECHNDVML